MKNLTYLPFIRNRYFYGKLLTAEDFSQEQQYGNDKRRMINRWLFGAGIVSGLEVIRVDDYSISLEMGLALDNTGREIAVETPEILKLSSLEGYEEATMEEGEESLYLCISYAEEPIEPVQNAANRAVHTLEEETCNKVREGYALYVTDDEPESVDRWETGMDELRYVYDRAERIHQEKYRQGIYLARIRLVKAGEFYMIDRVEPVPFGEYICCQPLLAGRIRELAERLDDLEMARREDRAAGKNAGGPEENSGKRKDTEGDWQFAQGRAKLSFPGGGHAGDLALSPEIAHGLGLGETEIILHIEQGQYRFGGAAGIFADAQEQQEESFPEAAYAEAAYRLKPSDGTFVIAVRLKEKWTSDTVEVGWTAIRKRSRNEFKAGEGRIFITPQLLHIKVRESADLQAVCVNIEDPELSWSVVTPEGGTVGEDGVYRAPNRPGVYEICCRNRNPEVRANVFAIVRE